MAPQIRSALQKTLSKRSLFLMEGGGRTQRSFDDGSQLVRSAPLVGNDGTASEKIKKIVLLKLVHNPLLSVYIGRFGLDFSAIF